MINFNNILIDPFNDGTDHITPNAVYLDKGPDWGSEDYYLYLGPSEEGCLSDNISFTDEFLNTLFKISGCRNYELHASENVHILYFDEEGEADNFYEELKDVINSYNLKIYTD